MLNQKLVSVIVPAYNSEQYLESTLRSIFEQDYQPLEVIVVDDGSTDSSAQIARSFKQVRYIYQKNSGPAAARNTGINNAKGEFIAFLDSDDLWQSNKLSLQVSYLNSHPDIELVFVHRRMSIEPGVKKPAWYKEQLFAYDSPCFGASSLLARSTIFKKVGLYNPDYRYGENAEWLTRVKEAGIQYTVLRETLLISRIHNGNLTHHLDEMRPYILRALKTSINRKRSSNARG